MSLYLTSYILGRILIHIIEIIYPNLSIFAITSTKILPAFDMIFLYHSIITSLSIGSDINESFG